MRHLPGTGIPIDSSRKLVSETSLVVCGESPSAIFSTADEFFADWKHENLTWGFREFYFRKYTRRDQSLNIMIGGLGSASVELILQEGALAGVKNFFLTGTCATLEKNMPLGSFFLPNIAHLRPGAFSEYDSTIKHVQIESPFQEKFKSYLSDQKIQFTEGAIISTDAFYGVGGDYDLSGKPKYAGAPLRNKALPKALPLALENLLKVEALDMECAVFFALGKLIQGINVAAMKVVSNAIPWDKNFDQSIIEQSLKKSVEISLGFLCNQ